MFYAPFPVCGSLGNPLLGDKQILSWRTKGGRLCCLISNPFSPKIVNKSS